jgi:hypothetical protein
VRGLTLLALLLAASWVAAAPAPLPKARRKAERPAAPEPVVINFDGIDAIVILNVNVQPLGQPAPPPPAQAPAQPRNADPPG